MINGIIMGSVLTCFALFSLLIRTDWEVKQTALIERSVGELYEFLSILKNWPKWQLTDVNEIAFLYVGPDQGEGATQYWEISGTPASLRIGKCEHFKSIHYQMRINQGETVLRWAFQFKDEGDSTFLTWSCKGTSKRGPFNRYFSLFYKWKTKNEMKVALQNLEKMNVHDQSYEQSA